ncbi:MAG: tRNA (N6-threonylcarbamoyladenosine(37)-N6)-methyltransferase TrmO [Planctomycetota bacterium]|nr:tRNA (N6-threonylcarbamoyladenosine(37)-N6)-methyltransferase TrmO [Planctomycetota bacterium]
MTTTANKPNAVAAPEPLTVRPIGYVQSDYAQPDDVPHTHNGWTADVSHIRLLSKHAAGLGGLKGYSHMIVLFWVHRAKDWHMPKNHRKPRGVKVFATRMPVRPNPIGMSVVELLDFSPRNGKITVRGLDALDGTPVLDIKPYISNFDSYAEARVPSWVTRHLNSHFHSGAHKHAHEHHETSAGYCRTEG